MKVSELIRELEAFQKLHGDLDVEIVEQGPVGCIELLEEPEDLEDSQGEKWCMLWSEKTLDSYHEVFLDPAEDRSNQCSYCLSGDKPKLLDNDGVNVELSGNPGQWCHGCGEYFWPCPEKHPEHYPEMNEEASSETD